MSREPQPTQDHKDEQAINSTQVLLDDVHNYLENIRGEVLPHSAMYYFSQLALRAVETRERGNYGIAACLVLRVHGIEIIVYGENGMKEHQNPHAHAEMNAVATARLCMRAVERRDEQFILGLIQQGKIEIRKAPNMESSQTLYTTLEPCPMCTVGAVINPNVKKVVIAAEDPYSGSMLGGRLDKLPPVWTDQARAHGLEVVVTHSNDKNDTDRYLDPKLRELLLRVFFEHREELDRDLERGGFFDAANIGSAIDGWLNP